MELRYKPDETAKSFLDDVFEQSMNCEEQDYYDESVYPPDFDSLPPYFTSFTKSLEYITGKSDAEMLNFFKMYSRLAKSEDMKYHSSFVQFSQFVVDKMSTENLELLNSVVVFCIEISAITKESQFSLDLFNNGILRILGYRLDECQSRPETLLPRNILLLVSNLCGQGQEIAAGISENFDFDTFKHFAVDEPFSKHCASSVLDIFQNVLYMRSAGKGTQASITEIMEEIVPDVIKTQTFRTLRVLNTLSAITPFFYDAFHEQMPDIISLLSNQKARVTSLICSILIRVVSDHSDIIPYIIGHITPFVSTTPDGVASKCELLRTILAIDSSYVIDTMLLEIIQSIYLIMPNMKQSHLQYVALLLCDILDLLRTTIVQDLLQRGVISFLVEFFESSPLYTEIRICTVFFNLKQHDYQIDEQLQDSDAISYLEEFSQSQNGSLASISTSLLSLLEQKQ